MHECWNLLHWIRIQSDRLLLSHGPTRVFLRQPLGRGRNRPVRQFMLREGLLAAFSALQPASPSSITAVAAKATGVAAPAEPATERASTALIRERWMDADAEHTTVS